MDYDYIVLMRKTSGVIDTIRKTSRHTCIITPIAQIVCIKLVVFVFIYLFISIWFICESGGVGEFICLSAMCKQVVHRLKKDQLRKFNEVICWRQRRDEIERGWGVRQ